MSRLRIDMAINIRFSSMTHRHSVCQPCFPLRFRLSPYRKDLSGVRAPAGCTAAAFRKTPSAPARRVHCAAPSKVLLIQSSYFLPLPDGLAAAPGRIPASGFAHPRFKVGGGDRRTPAATASRPREPPDPARWSFAPARTDSAADRRRSPLARMNAGAWQSPLRRN